MIDFISDQVANSVLWWTPAFAIMFLIFDVVKSIFVSKLTERDQIVRIAFYSVLRKMSFIASGSVFIPLLLYMGVGFGKFAINDIENFVPIIALFLTLASVSIANYAAPRLLLIATGSTIMFFGAAMSFELLLQLIEWIEEAPNA